MDLLGSFQNMMLNVTADDLERVNSEPSDIDDSDASSVGGDQVDVDGDVDPAEPARDPDDAFARPSHSGPVAAPPIDSRARALAARLVGSNDTASPIPAGAWVILIDGLEVARLDTRTEGPLIIGRGNLDESSSRSGHLPVDLAVASRHHCQISLANGIATVADLDSKNGTYVRRGQQTLAVGTEGVELRDGDRITTAGGAALLASIGKVDP